ncbi:heavy metal-responsive transcriptional regulator [Phormidium tenue]|uniref:Heavy metal-responsive transcriptional regulator n=1 Tax=Phormidium tenue NIES-30 TaxID=549789 RepID=A0A1U7J9I7_9CYAN|nr:heavy metal-responsive transcriptional regulator [Phormidium tenue]MBD2230784.1 heavy metal-responsive transcriptional regulator [Phormidium tenue FACHB-1052]OKH50166.1 heavy metal-responsive transcriptional regulator [Phormidium tenue NIES-30]
MLIRDLSRATGVPASTIRYYERLGLLQVPRRSGAQYRLYETADVERLRFIQKAKRLGLSLTEIGQLMALRAGGIAPCQQLKAMVASHLQQLDQQIAELQTLRQELATYHADLASQLPDDAAVPTETLCQGIICGFIEQVSHDA